MQNVAQGETKLSRMPPYWAIFLIAGLCITNYLALFNNDFRQIFTTPQKSNEPPPSTLTQQEIAQLVLTAGLLGVSTIEVVEHVKDLIQKRKNLEIDIAKEKETYRTISREHSALKQRHVELGKAKFDQETRTKAAAKTLSTKTAPLIR